ncbi:MAG: 2Fe-2S iron-sulfur cluster binding domain-containing protein, partial [Alphaproteobacteria bacterium]|nr:2Fe-2S iron-sulfur cluster binding domain-containing protein [Alphaproteobacteria bacterium]
MREDIILMLNGEIERILPIKSDLTLMNWLRNNKNLTGTKEGCAEGDCGACTVVIGRYDYSSKAVAWRAVNSCILFLPMLDGCSVRTVEGLASNTGELHPVQTAFVENHASQCGFCTPGFVMSLYAGWCKNRILDNAAIDDLFAGNLCRCTG